MKLSDKEAKLISQLTTRRKHRKWDAWLSFVLAVGLLVAVEGYGLLPSLGEFPFTGMAVGATFAYLIHVYFAVRPDDKLIDLLQRYVNRDPEAIAKVAGVTTIDGC